MLKEKKLKVHTKNFMALWVENVMRFSVGLQLSYRSVWWRCTMIVNYSHPSKLSTHHQ